MLALLFLSISGGVVRADQIAADRQRAAALDSAAREHARQRADQHRILVDHNATSRATARLPSGSAEGWQAPVQDVPVSTPYGETGPWWTWKGYHTGDDYAVPSGTKVRAASQGTVRQAGYVSSAYGYGVVISHGDGVTTLYAHLSDVSVSPGERVEAGEIIGRSGASGNVTGPHLHFEVREHDEPVSPDGFTRGVDLVWYPRQPARPALMR